MPSRVTSSGAMCMVRGRSVFLVADLLGDEAGDIVQFSRTDIVSHLIYALGQRAVLAQPDPSPGDVVLGDYLVGVTLSPEHGRFAELQLLVAVL